MVCLLCLSMSDQMLNIFDQNGINLNISNIISQHFWFQPEPMSSKSICCPCWNKVESFHNFYQTIEEAHSKLTNCLEISKERSETEETNAGALSNFFEPVVKRENSEETEVRVPETAQSPSYHAFTAETENNERKDAPSSNSESELPLLRLRNQRKSIKPLKCEEETKGSELDSDKASTTQDKDEYPQESNSETDTDYTSPKKKSKVKVPKRNSFLNKTTVNRKDFDKFIKQNMQLKCQECDKELENFVCLKEHYKKAHKKDGYVICCDTQFTSRYSLVHHLILHQDPDLYKCEKCGRVLANKRSFLYHMSYHASIQEANHKCTKCNKSFTALNKLEKHLKTHIRHQKKQICDQCGKVYHSTQSLFAHHKREHLGFVREKVQCQKCGVYLAEMSTLKFHMKHLHPETAVLNVCNICGKISATAYGLLRHKKYMHSMERVHKCNICEDKAFKTAQILREHMTTHTGEVLYTCPHCPKTFNSNANMHSHRKKMHRKEWEENRRHPHMGATTNATETEENNQ